MDNILAHKILLNHLTIGDGQFQVRALGVQQIHREVLQPAVLRKKLPVPFRGVPCAFISGVAFHNGSAHIVDDALPEIRSQEILVALLTGMDFHCHIAGQFLTCQLIEFQHLLRGNGPGKIHSRAHNRSSCQVF